MSARVESHAADGAGVRTQLLAGIRAVERRRVLAGLGTSVLEAGEGPPMVLLHGPGGYAAMWQQVIPGLAAGHHVIAPDLPGHGASSLGDGRLDADRMMTWLDELIAQTCPTAPVLVGQLVGGAIAARFAAEQGGRVDRLVLVVPFGLAPFQPAPAFGAALTRFLEEPGGASHDDLWDRCVFDLDGLRRRPAVRWEAMRAYSLELARTEHASRALGLLMEAFGFGAIPEEALASIALPTTLIWGRYDSIVPLAVGEAASERFGWPLRVIEDAGNEPAIEAPEAFLQALLGDREPAAEGATR